MLQNPGIPQPWLLQHDGGAKPVAVLDIVTLHHSILDLPIQVHNPTPGTTFCRDIETMTRSNLRRRGDILLRIDKDIPQTSPAITGLRCQRYLVSAAAGRAPRMWQSTSFRGPFPGLDIKP